MGGGALGGVGGVVSKPDKPYAAGRTASGWLKWRRRHTLEAAVIGVTQYPGGPDIRPGPAPYRQAGAGCARWV